MKPETTTAPRTGEDAQLSKGDVEFLLLTACDQISKLERKNAALVAALESLLRNATDKARYIAALESPESDIEAASLPDEALDSPEMKQARGALAAARNA